MALPGAGARAQQAANAPPPAIVGLRDIGSTGEDWWRVRQLLGLDSTAGFLARTGGASATAPAAAARLAIVLPDVRVVWNSRLPLAGNTGQLWAARGLSVSLRGGAALAVGRARVVLAPELTHTQNLGYPVFPGTAPGRSAFSSPFHLGAASADLPLRFGTAPVTQIGLGQSSAELRLGAAAVGASGETMWWGPGVRNALLVSNNAEGVPHAFVRTARPVRTPVGAIEGRWILGALTQSLYFDSAGGRGLRALSGGVATLRLPHEPGLTIGVARLVLSPVGRRRELAGHAADAVLHWSPRRPADGDSSAAYDQLTSLFARWVFAPAGFEAYAEWARSELPRSFREALLAPQRAQAYTVGASQAAPLGRAGVLRVQLELTSLEQARSLTDLPDVPDYYTTRSAPQGFTQRGRVLGAAIGPGGSSQWLAVDAYHGAWQVGAFAERVRRENDALYRQFLPNLFRHDVSVEAGAHVARRLPGVDVSVEAAYADRLNYLFQNGAANVGRFRTIDIHNVRVSVRLSPRSRDGRPTSIRAR